RIEERALFCREKPHRSVKRGNLHAAFTHANVRLILFGLVGIARRDFHKEARAFRDGVSIGSSRSEFTKIVARSHLENSRAIVKLPRTRSVVSHDRARSDRDGAAVRRENPRARFQTRA